MEELIKQAFLHVDVIGPHVHEGHYDLVGPDGEIILPQVWETMVQPDWAITMHMWPMPEPPPPPPEPPKDIPPPPPEPVLKAKAKGKAKKRESHHIVVPPPAPAAANQPSVVVVPDPAPASTPGVVNVTASSHAARPSKKVAPSPFMRWAAGGSSTRSQSLKGLKKPEGLSRPISAAHSNADGCLVM
jgi:hypothetical protein